MEGRGGWFTRIFKGSYGVGLWKEISKEASLLKFNSVLFVGDGSMVNFWEDVWCDEDPCVRSSLHFLLWQIQKKQRLRRFGRVKGKRGVQGGGGTLIL